MVGLSAKGVVVGGEASTVHLSVTPIEEWLGEEEREAVLPAIKSV